MAEQDDDATLDRIYDALDEGDLEVALELAGKAIEALPEGEDDPVLRFLAGYALLEMDQPEDAAEQLSLSVGMDPDDAESRAALALAFYRCARFRDAGEHAVKALEADPKSPDALNVRALLLEREGDAEEADRLFERAARLDPERYPAPVRFDRRAFEAEVVRAGEMLPAEFRRRLGEVAVLVEDLPSDGILLDENPALDPELLGLFVGTALPDRTFSGPSAEPPRILLFQRNLERFVEDADRLREEIAKTLHHELGHYLGLDEEGLEQIDLA
jgi:predicted Zn-dependent protease with MMP-like domain